MVKCMITSWGRNKWKRGLLVKGMYPKLGTLLQSYARTRENGAHLQGIGARENGSASLRGYNDVEGCQCFSKK